MSKIAAMLPALAAGGTAAAGVSMPMLLGSMALQGVGSFMQNREKQRALERRNDATAEIDAQQRQQQEALAAESQAALDRLVQQHGADQRQADIDAAVADRAAAIMPGEDTPILPATPGLERAGTVVQEDAVAQMNRATKEARARLAALAGLSGFGANEQRLQSDRATGATDMGVIGDLRRGGLAAAEDAKRYHDLELQNFTPSPLGGIISGIGQLGMYGAGRGAGVTSGTPIPYNTAGWAGGL